MPASLMLSPRMLGKYDGQNIAAFLAVLFLAFLFIGASVGQTPDDTAPHDTGTLDYYPRNLDHKLRLIVESDAPEVLPLQNVSRMLLHDMNTVVLNIEHNPNVPVPEWNRLEESLKVLDTLRQSWSIQTTTECPYIPSAFALEEITLALHRRIYVWAALLHAEAAEATPISVLYDKSFDDVARLKERTLAVEQYFMRLRRPVDYQTGLTWREYLETQSLITELEACRPPSEPTLRLVSYSPLPESAPTIPIDILKTLSSKANTTIHRLASPTLTEEQRRLLNHPAVHVWKEELQRWATDLVTPIYILQLLEQYEETGGMSDMRSLAQFIDQLSVSKTDEYRQLGEHVRRQYGMPSVNIFLSNALLNNHLPMPGSEIASFRDVIQSQPVVGRRQTETEFQISFIQHPTRVLTTLDVGIDLSTISRSDAFATQLYNTGQTQVIARKLIEWTETGFRTEPTQARILEHRMRLIRFNTSFDEVPLLAGLFRGVVRNQYEDRYQDARTETQRKILRQVRNQIDRETEQKLQPVNEKIRAFTQYIDEGFDLRVEQRESRTDENWLLTSWGVRGKGALSSHTPAPATLPGSFADMKIHESFPNMLLGKLELEGKHGTVREFKEMLAEKFQQPGLASEEENDDIELMFAMHNPVSVRFVDGRAELKISIAALRLLGKTHRNFQVIVRYKPASDAEGRLVLERDGYISLPGARDQLVLRAAFGKIFPKGRPFLLVPKIFETDPQFDYLTTGHCRIEKGWFALALVESEPGASHQPQSQEL